MVRLEHLGIAVNSLDHSIPLYERLLNTSCYKTETVSSENVHTAFFRVGETKIELLESSSATGVIRKFIDQRGEGMHHVAFEVDDIFAEISRLQSEGFRIIDPLPKAGADNKLICFVHPRDTTGVLIEICQERR